MACMVEGFPEAHFLLQPPPSPGLSAVLPSVSSCDSPIAPTLNFCPLPGSVFVWKTYSGFFLLNKALLTSSPHSFLPASDFQYPLKSFCSSCPALGGPVQLTTQKEPMPFPVSRAHELHHGL